MDLRYEAYCFADRWFYDTEDHGLEHLDSWVSTLSGCVHGWRRFDRGGWHVCLPDGVDLPMQGWKVHISAGRADARRVLDIVRPYCVRIGIPFKFLRSARIHANRNAKYADRAASGKLITIYPVDETQLKRVLEDLSERLTGVAGPHIPGEARYGEGPLYIKFGGFVERMITEGTGATIPALERPDGTLVPEESRRLPDWVRVPAFLRSHIDPPEPDIRAPYRVDSAHHVTNAGGVYLATRRSDSRQVVLKEARPYTGLDQDCVDAVTRLEREARTLTALAGVSGVPELHERFSVWGNEYMAMSAVPGMPLCRWLARHNPLTQRDTTRSDRGRYVERALGVLSRVERILADIHRRGLVFGDLNDRNILVDEDDSVSLVDFELAFPARDPHRPPGGTPGFRAPNDRTGYEVDRYSFAVLRLWMFLPMTTVLDMEPDKLADFVRYVRKRFDLPLGYLEEVLAELRPRSTRSARRRTALDQPEVNWTAVRRSIADAILASATPARTDRLFPGDIQQFATGATGFGHGAAGVLHALDVTGAGRFPMHEQWLLEAVRRDPPTTAGFFNGAYGTAYVLENFGYQDAVDDLIDRFEPQLATITCHGLRTGLAGIGLNLLHLAASRQDAGHLWHAVEIGERLTGMLANVPLPGPGIRGRAGLMHGWSGPALLFLRLFERTRDRGWLDQADLAIRRDLLECTRGPDGSVQVRDGLRTLPYLEVGSAGIVLVMTELLSCWPGAPCAMELPKLRRALMAEFVIQPGLMLGRAGLLAALAAGQRRDPDPISARATDQHLDWLALHAVPYHGHIAFPGTHLLRLSMDVATGGAGVLLALASVLDGAQLLPFLSDNSTDTAPLRVLNSPHATVGVKTAGVSSGRNVRVGPGGRV
ncbi:class III lanthionine synthetase LanKC [Actinocrispum wychmicini]|uniref:Protein kinase-like protein n=1 Tax=Actinocrispum wychmicini TaxID=1213861 RepID=A0A4R2JVI2_9PSEU|nr:class III lanthionine synthetase LanKC [Actinocrispum wychmicini]TCO64471.1 protein kinase-like protein [Actinocrispum wychmicini]